MHVPKAGSSFATTIAHWADVDGQLPADAALQELSKGDTLSSFLQTFKYPKYTWDAPGRIAEGQFPFVGFGHRALKDAVYNEWTGEWAAMFRSPASRARSHYNHGLVHGNMEALHTDCAELYPGTRFMTGEEALGATPAHAGLMTKMVAGQQNGLCGFAFCVNQDTTNTTWPYANSKTWKALGCEADSAVVPDTELAISRLAGFKFVGLQEQWALSTCLFHAMLGGECFAVEDSSARTASYAPDIANASFATSTFSDPSDEALYAAVVRRFNADLLAHNVSEASCRKTCPGFASDDK
jgi:hypothetical protein